MSWGINPNASEKEKIKAEFADYLGGLNSCCLIDYSLYSQLFDYGMDLLEKMYKQGANDVSQEILEKLLTGLQYTQRGLPITEAACKIYGRNIETVKEITKEYIIEEEKDV